jgi:hypothetical protein
MHSLLEPLEDLMREAIREVRGNQRGHQRPSVVIRGHPRHTCLLVEAIREAIRGNQRGNQRGHPWHTYLLVEAIARQPSALLRRGAVVKLDEDEADETQELGTARQRLEHRVFGALDV